MLLKGDMVACESRAISNISEYFQNKKQDAMLDYLEQIVEYR